MNKDSLTAQDSRGIRPGVWLSIVIGVIAIGLTGFLVRRGHKPDETTRAEASHNESAVTLSEGATAPSKAGQMPATRFDFG